MHSIEKFKAIVVENDEGKGIRKKRKSDPSPSSSQAQK